MTQDKYKLECGLPWGNHVHVEFDIETSTQLNSL